ncbi:MAG: ShlB/FhaC/HecB family hemolysin secretion/activation protein [Burkholderiales bacterium]|nr:ShlB/FhaC/HecB family hemolysin secretion/activation protein [Burkholderiales bacterium]
MRVVLPFHLLVVAMFAAFLAGGAFAQAAADRFDLLEFEVEGNSVLPVAAIERAVYRFLGEQKTVKDVEAAREALEKAYQDAGFLSVFVDIPEQKIVDGVVVLRVTEGRVARLRVAGTRYYAQGALKARVPALAEGEVPYFPDVQAQLAQLNRTEDRQVAPVLRAGRAPGTVEAELKVEDRLPLHGQVELNNRYSFDTSRPRLSATLRYANLWQRDHSASLTYLTAPAEPSQVKVFSGTYVLPVGAGSVLALYAVKSDSNITSLGTASILGRGEIVGARLILPLPARGAYSHSLTLGVDAKDFRENILFGADSTATPIRYLPFSVAYGGRFGAGGALTQFTLTANAHFRRLGDEDVECSGQRVSAFACKRFGADANYFYLRAEASRLQPLPGGIALFARLAGQHASQPLISNEQFGAGGADSVRGYTEFERVGDRGVSGTLELRSASLVDARAATVQEAVLSAFVDGAALGVQRPTAGQAFKFHLASAGFGLRVKAWQGVQAALDIAWPLRDGARSSTRSPRAHVRLAYEF